MELIFDLFGNDFQKTIKEKWADYTIEVTYKRRIQCTKPELIEEFKSAYVDINSLAKERQDAMRKKAVIPSQKVQWQKFLSVHLISHPYLCQVISIMLSMAPNTGWVERAYSVLEMICSKRRNCLDPVNMEPLFLLAVLKLAVKSSGDYQKEIATMNG